MRISVSTLEIDNKSLHKPHTHVGTVQECKYEDRQVVSEGSINDRSKSVALTKSFAIIQSTWLIVQCIA